MFVVYKIRSEVAFSFKTYFEYIAAEDFKHLKTTRTTRYTQIFLASSEEQAIQILNILEDAYEYGVEDTKEEIRSREEET